ncbi:DUF6285 domain-containing protein [Metapseudomonas boanensis]|uniref:DUF6285 domain-containing protein n=1 Tax=Metapseudomonas boanensis TaxID=2822138 RepID=A0ABS5XG98_9GAMM|nr:DUF6285 domain-containing protein [Pseudomonas boanensis]MBT8766711.1 hypothetical protein [Pseudomonas boanensis]
MSRLPDATDLLVTAREALLRRLLPSLPEALHYEARMIANAMAIAARECHATTAVDLARERELSSGIRRGLRDDASTRRELLAITLRKLEVSNPRLLAIYSEKGD